MQLIEIILFLTLLLLLSTIVNHYVKAIPVSLIQVVFGCGLALIGNFSINLSTDWFLLLFIAPLLFNDGRRFPKDELWELRWPIFANAIILVFITMFFGGLLIYKLIPSMPLPVAFSLAAILSPTDPIAVESIAKKVRLPKNILHLVNGESLINDASGLIGFKYAIAATVYGAFSLKNAVGDFFYISIVGAIIGVATMLVISLVRKWLYKNGLTNLVFNVVLQIVSPFVIYLLSEDVFHASGVIAVVTAGIVYHVNNTSTQSSSAELQLISEQAWNIIVYLLNGIVFLILGIELPFAMEAVINDMKFNTFQSIGYAVVTWLIILIIRIVWIILYEICHNLITTKKIGPIDIRAANIVGFSGVRGAITMAGILSIPLITVQNEAFPDRELVLFIASIVIVLSLLAAVIVLPLISKNDPVVSYNNDNHWSEEKARIYVLNYVIDDIKQMERPDKHICNILIDQCELMIRQLSSIKPDELEKSIRSLAVEYEHQAVKKLVADNVVTSKEANAINYQINHRELKNLVAFNDFNFKLEIMSAIQTTKLWLFKQRSDKEQKLKIQKALIMVNDYTVQKLKEHGDSKVIKSIVDEYTNLSLALRTRSLDYEKYYRIAKERELEAYRKGIQELLINDKISLKLASKLRQEVNYVENNELSTD